MINEFGLDYVVHLVLLIFVGVLWGGVIRIVRGKVVIGVLYILTGAFFGIGWLIDLINMLTKKNFATAQFILLITKTVHVYTCTFFIDMQNCNYFCYYNHKLLL